MTVATAREAALRYLAQRHPELAGRELAVLELEAGWLVETTLPAHDLGAPGDRLLLMVKREGHVDEIGRALPRQNANRYLTGLKDVIRPRFAY